MGCEINTRDIKTIAFSFQTVGTDPRASNTNLNYVVGFQYLTSRISPEGRIIVAGVASPGRVKILKAICKNKISVLNQTAYVQSRRGVLVATGKSAACELSKNKLLARNIEFYDKMYVAKAAEEGTGLYYSFLCAIIFCSPKHYHWLNILLNILGLTIKGTVI